MTTQEKKQMYNRIMEATSQMVVKMLNEEKLDELSLPLVSRAHHKSVKFGNNMDEEYFKYMKRITLNLSQPLIPELNAVTVFINSNVEDSDYNEEYDIEIKYFNIEDEDYVIFFNAKYIPEKSLVLTNLTVEDYSNDFIESEPEWLKKILSAEKDASYDDKYYQNEFFTSCKLMGKKDAMTLQKKIFDETGVDISWRNFGLTPQEFRYSNR